MASRRKSSSRKTASRKATRSAKAESAKARADQGNSGLPRRSRWFLLIGFAALAAMAVLAAGLVLNHLAGESLTSSDLDPKMLSFVGSETCIGCHERQGQLWRSSQHAHAMAHASPETVLGDFDNAAFDYFGVTSRFTKRDGKFYVETDGPDGALETFEVKYTFGLEPLQQYLIEFPGGRVQALTIAWDSRPRSEGGQRWFHLYPDERIGHDDPLHWTKLNQNWNFMCAECHSTGVAKNYDPKTGRYHTTWKEITVGCEACHGEGSAHAAWAKSWSPFASEDKAMGLLARFDERAGITWALDGSSDQPQRSATPKGLRKEVEMCGRCHARRGILSEAFVPGQPLSNSHQVALLIRGLYQPDGQKRDEVYNYGSFKQSKMYAAGVTCSNCHDPHSGKLPAETYYADPHGTEAPLITREQVCLQCHTGSYAKASHTHHEGENAPSCVACHMPARKFMVIDTRHDHSFRVPRPDLSVTLGVDNACADCHTDKSPEWAAAAIEDWFGPERKGFQTFGPAFHAARTGAPDAAGLLAAVALDGQAPAIVRATALEELTSYPSTKTAAAVREGLDDPDPMVRIAALDHLEAAPGAQLWPLISGLLDDPVRGVRTRAGFLLAGSPTQSMRDRERLAEAEKEFVAAQELNADRPESRSLLARYYTRKGEGEKAEAEYRQALRLSPHFTPAAVNLADLYRHQGHDEDGVSILREAIEVSPNDGGLHHALGLALVRLKKSSAAIEELRRAAELEPDRARYAYVYAVGLESIGKREDAIAALKDALDRHPNNREILMALVNFSRGHGDLASALAYAEQLATVEPDNRDLEQLIEVLKKQGADPQSTQ